MILKVETERSRGKGGREKGDVAQKHQNIVYPFLKVWVGGGLIRSLGGWSKVISSRQGGERQAYDARVLGSGEFVEGLLREADEAMVRQIRDKPGRQKMNQAVKGLGAEAGVRWEEVCGGSQRREVAAVRAKAAYRLNREMGVSMAEIARYLGVGASAIAMAIRKEERGK